MIRLSRLILGFLLGVFFLLRAGPLAPCFASPDQPGVLPWTKGLYMYRGSNRPLVDVLADFAQQFGIKLQASKKITGTYDGVVRSKSPTQFLDGLASIYGFDWFYYDGVLYATSNTEHVTRIISVRKSNMKGIRDTIAGVGLLNDRFGWSEVPEQDIVVVSGPQVYIDLVEGLIARFNVAPKDVEIAVMRLRYGSASDVVLPSGDGETIVIPGVVRTLDRLLRDGGVAQVEEVKEKISEQEAATLGSQEARDLVSIQADDRLNAVIIRAPRFLIGLYRSLVEKLDVPTDLVEIDAVVIDVTLGKGEDFGIRWSAGSGKFRVGYGLEPNRGDSADRRSGNEAMVNLGLPFGSASLAFDAGHFLSRLKILERDGRAQTISRPSILMMDNTTAVYDSSRTFYILNNTARTATTKSVSAGLSLKVKPRVIRDGGRTYVQMWLDVQDGGFDEKDQGVQGYPVVRNHAVRTILMLGEGESTLIAGDHYDHVSHSTRGVPFLKDIPYLGWFFSERINDSSKRQRFFLLTPRVISAAGLSSTDGDQESLALKERDVPANLRPSGVREAFRAVSPGWEKEKEVPPPPHLAPEGLKDFLPDDDKVLEIGPKRQASYKGRMMLLTEGHFRRSPTPPVLMRQDGVLL